MKKILLFIVWLVFLLLFSLNFLMAANSYRFPPSTYWWNASIYHKDQDLLVLPIDYHRCFSLKQGKVIRELSDHLRAFQEFKLGVVIPLQLKNSIRRKTWKNIRRGMNKNINQTSLVTSLVPYVEWNAKKRFLVLFS